MEKYKIQMKAYRKKRMKSDSTPYLPPDGVVQVIDSLNPGKKIDVQVIKTKVQNEMHWDDNWEAFTCTKHGKKAIYELVIK